ncbi:hypothetical protein FNF07_12440 [Trinickia caryophylli]|nr:hypothetical protein C0Z17_28295 [Trinickia caryophylli]TRX18959.1 hypothetical protein FNF07_12440 [Trinickia caryophylli]
MPAGQLHEALRAALVDCYNRYMAAIDEFAKVFACGVARRQVCPRAEAHAFDCGRGWRNHQCPHASGYTRAAVGDPRQDDSWSHSAPFRARR